MASHTRQHRGVRFTLERESGEGAWFCLIRIPKALSGRAGTYRGMGGDNMRLLRRRAIRFIDAITNAAKA